MAGPMGTLEEGGGGYRGLPGTHGCDLPLQLTSRGLSELAAQLCPPVFREASEL